MGLLTLLVLITLGIGQALGISVGIIGGSIISGLILEIKMSPLSDTTNLACMSGHKFIYSYKIHDVYYYPIL